MKRTRQRWLSEQLTYAQKYSQESQQGKVSNADRESGGGEARLPQYQESRAELEHGGSATLTVY